MASKKKNPPGMSPLGTLIPERLHQQIRTMADVLNIQITDIAAQALEVWVRDNSALAQKRWAELHAVKEDKLRQSAG